jgi:hypothetical protein
MNPYSDPIFPMGQAARLAGLSEKTVRNWIDREQIDLPDPEPGMVRRRLSMADVIQISLVGAVVKFGFDVAVASDAISATVGKTLERAKRTGSGPEGLQPLIAHFLVVSADGKAKVIPFNKLNNEAARLGTAAVIELGSLIAACGDRFNKAVRAGDVVKAAVQWAEEFA